MMDCSGGFGVMAVSVTVWSGFEVGWASVLAVACFYSFPGSLHELDCKLGVSWLFAALLVSMV